MQSRLLPSHQVRHRIVHNEYNEPNATTITSNDGSNANQTSESNYNDMKIEVVEALLALSQRAVVLYILRPRRETILSGGLFQKSQWHLHLERNGLGVKWCCRKGCFKNQNDSFTWRETDLEWNDVVEKAVSKTTMHLHLERNGLGVKRCNRKGHCKNQNGLGEPKRPFFKNQNGNFTRRERNGPFINANSAGLPRTMGT